MKKWIVIGVVFLAGFTLGDFVVSHTDMQLFGQIQQDRYRENVTQEKKLNACQVQLQQASSQVQQRQESGQISAQQADIMLDILKAVLR